MVVLDSDHMSLVERGGASGSVFAPCRPTRSRRLLSALRSRHGAGLHASHERQRCNGRCPTMAS